MINFLKNNWEYIGIGVILVFFIVVVIIDINKKKKNKTKEVQKNDLLNNILNGLGGITNLTSFIVKGSRVEFIIKEQNLIDKIQLEKVGIKGVVLNSNKVTLIVGSEASLIFKDLKLN